MTNSDFIQCHSCKETVPDAGKFCSHCGAYFAIENIHIDEADFNEQAEYYIHQAAEDIIATGGNVTQNNVGRMIITGAAAGALAGITIAQIAAGMIAGVGKGAYQHFRGNDDE